MRIKNIKILTFTIFLIMNLVWQIKTFASEVYVPKVIIEGKWCENYFGCKEPGRFGFTMWEGEPDFPSSFVVDKKGNIYILDKYNNRIQVFDSDGQYIKSISVKSYEDYTEEEAHKIAREYQEKYNTA